MNTLFKKIQKDPKPFVALAVALVLALGAFSFYYPPTDNGSNLTGSVTDVRRASQKDKDLAKKMIDRRRAAEAGKRNKVKNEVEQSVTVTEETPEAEAPSKPGKLQLTKAMDDAYNTLEDGFVSLLTFEMEAENEDIEVSGFKFAVSKSGSVELSDTTLIVEKKVSAGVFDEGFYGAPEIIWSTPGFSGATYPNLNDPVVIPANKSYRFTLRATASKAKEVKSFITAQLGGVTAKGMNSGYETDGPHPNLSIYVGGFPIGYTWESFPDPVEATEPGSLTLGKVYSIPKLDFESSPASGTGQELLSFTLSANENEDLVLKKLVFDLKLNDVTVEDAHVFSAGGTFIGFGNNTDAVNNQLVFTDEVTIFAGTARHFTLAADVETPFGNSATPKPDFYGLETSLSPSNIEVVGASSAFDIEAGGETVSIEVGESTPQVQAWASKTPGSPTVLIDGFVDVLKFKIEAKNGAIQLPKMSFQLNQEGVTVNSVQLKRDGQVLGVVAGGGSFAHFEGLDEVIAQDQEANFTLTFEIEGADNVQDFAFAALNKVATQVKGVESAEILPDNAKKGGWLGLKNTLEY